MSNARPTCQFFAPYLESSGNKHPIEDKAFEAQSDIESQSFKKPRVSKAVSNSRMPVRQSDLVPCNFKTQLCRKYKLGICSYGGRCFFAHGMKDIRNTWHGEKELLGRTRNGDHRTSNELKLCRLFYSGKKCIYGDQCRYLHENIREKTVRSISTTGRGLLTTYMASGRFAGGHTATSSFYKTTELHGYTAVESGTVQTNNSKTSNGRIGNATIYKQQVQGTKCNFMWNELEKMSRIYADWIEDAPLLHGSSSKVEASSLV